MIFKNKFIFCGRIMIKRLPQDRQAFQVIPEYHDRHQGNNLVFSVILIPDFHQLLYFHSR